MPARRLTGHKPTAAGRRWAYGVARKQAGIFKRQRENSSLFSLGGQAYALDRYLATIKVI